MNARSMIRFVAGLIGMTCTALLLVADSAECSGNGFGMTFAGSGTCGGSVTLTLYQEKNTCGMNVMSSDTAILPSGASTDNGDPRNGNWTYEGEVHSAGDSQGTPVAIRRCEATRVGNTLRLDCFDRPVGCFTTDGGVVVPEIEDGGIDACAEMATCGMVISGR